MNHTPGPWYVYPQSDYITAHDTDDSLFAVATVTTEIDGLLEGDPQANARLIAAAPDLLEACRQFLAAERLADEFGVDGAETIEALIEASELARVAIAKAGGRE